MERIRIRHLSGARTGEVDDFPLAGTNEILVGRDPDAQVRFDPSREDLVSRQHVKIVRDPESPNEFAVVDLQSRNGTFLNRQRVYASARLTHNDVIQLGPAGPEFRFERDPAPLNQTGQHPVALMVSPPRDTMPLPGAPRPIGRATVERMLGDTFTKVKHESDKAVWVGAAALTAILVVGGAMYLYQRQNALEANQQAQQNQQLLQQVGQDLKRTPQAAEAMRQEVLRLNEEMRLADSRSEARLLKLSRDLAAQQAATRQDQVAAARQAVRELAVQSGGSLAPAASQGDTPSSTPVTEPARGAGQPADYDAAVRQGIELLRTGDAAGALKLAQQMMQTAPARWEAYSIAGSVAKIQNRPSQARSMFEKALALAPDEVKPSLQQALQEVARGQ